MMRIASSDKIMLKEKPTALWTGKMIAKQRSCRCWDLKCKNQSISNNLITYKTINKGALRSLKRRIEAQASFNEQSLMTIAVGMQMTGFIRSTRTVLMLTDIITRWLTEEEKFGFAYLSMRWTPTIVTRNTNATSNPNWIILQKKCFPTFQISRVVCGRLPSRQANRKNPVPRTMLNSMAMKEPSNPQPLSSLGRK